MSAKLFTDTIASGASTGGGVDLGFAENFNFVFVNNKAGAEITLQASNDNSEWSDILLLKDQGSALTFATLVYPSAASGQWREGKIAHRYLRGVATGTVANGGTIEFSVILD